MSEEVTTTLSPKPSFKATLAEMNSAISRNEIKHIYSLLDRYKENNTSNSDIFRILYQSYHETMIRNVPLTDCVKLVVESELIDIYYHCFDTTDDYPSNLSYIRGKIRSIGTAIGQLQKHEGPIDQKFTYVMTVIVKDIYLLKRSLKFTYDRIPWEEIEFCLTIFVLSHKSVDEMNLYYHSYLRRQRIMRHLQIFLDCLNKVDKSLTNETDISKGLPTKPRPDIVKQICRDCSQMIDLYDDFHRLRDICSFNEIEKYLRLVRSCDASQMKGRLTILRSLQVMGEHMKNTLGSPKMSPFSVNLLVSRMTDNTKKMITKMRDNISHNSVTNMTSELNDKTLFVTIKNDLEKTSDTVRQCFMLIKINAFKHFTKRFENIENLETIAEDIESLYYVDHEKTLLFDPTSKLVEIVQTLQPNPIVKTGEFSVSDNLYDIAQAVIRGIELPNNRLSIVSQKFVNNLKVLKEIKGKDQLWIEIIKKEVASLHKVFTKAGHPMFEILMNLLMDYMFSFGQTGDESKIEELNSIGESFFTYNSNTSIEKLWMLWVGLLGENIPEVEQECLGNPESDADEIWKFLENDLAKLFENIRSGVEVVVDKEQLALIELYILDHLPCSKADLNQKNFELFDNIPLLLTGKRLRNHLAHHNFLNYILIPDITVALITNATALYRKHSVNFITEAASELSLVDHEEDLEILNLQNRLFVDLMKGDLDELLENAYSESDYRGRDAQGRGSFHYAAMAQRLDVVKYLFERSDLHLNINAQDIYFETPLHISARLGRLNVTKFLLDHSADYEIRDRNGFQPVHYAIANDISETTKLLLNNSDASDNCASNRNTPLHVAAKFGSLVVTKYLIDNSDTKDFSKENSEGLTPLQTAVFYSHIDLLKMLFEKVKHNSEEFERILCTAVSSGNEDIVHYLLGDRVLANSFTWTSPLLDAALLGNVKIVSALLKHNFDVNIVDLDGLTPLHYILLNIGAKNNVEVTLGIVGDLIRAGFSVNARSDLGYTPLYCSLEQSIYVVELLLECGADVNAQTITGNTSLHKAASLGAADKINLLLKFSGDLNIVNNDGFTPLHFAATKDDFEVLELLLDKNLNIYSKDRCGNEPLHVSASYGCKLIAGFIFDKTNNANIDVTNHFNLTPLHFAVVRENLEYIQYLISKGANVNLKDLSGQTPLHLAIRKGNISVVKLLLDNGAEIDALDISRVSPLTIAVRYNMTSIVQLLLKRGSKIDMYAVNSSIKTSSFMTNKIILANRNHLTINIQGFSVLHCAARNGSPELVNQLLLNGADVNAVDDKNFTPLHHATNRGDTNVVNILLSYGAEPHNKQNRITPLELSIFLGKTKLVRLFLEKSRNNIDLNQLDEIGKSLIHKAILAGHKDIVELLINKGANINLTDNGCSLKPVYQAAFLGNSEIVILLLNKGCEIENTLGYTLLHYAAHYGRSELIKTLIGMQFDINVKSDEGLTPLHVAARRNHKAAVLTLLNHGAQLSPNAALSMPEIAEIIKVSDKLYDKVIENDLEGARKCIEKGAVTNTTASTGETALHCAVTNSFIDMINILLDNNCNPNIKNEFGMTALHLAAKSNNSRIVKLLLASGAHFDSLSSAGETPLDLTDDEIIKKVLNEITDVFEMAERNEIELVERVKRTLTNDPSMKIILINSRNKEDKTLLEILYRNDFVVTQDVKKLLDQTLFSVTSVAKNMANKGEIYEALSTVDNFELQYKPLKNVILWDLKLMKAHILCHSLQIESCRTLLNSVYKEQEELLGPEHRLTLSTLIQKAKFLSFVGELDNALKILRTIYQLLNRSDEERTDSLTGEKMNIFCRCSSLIGSTLCDLMKYDEALAYSKDAYFNLCRERGQENENTLEAQVIYASILLSLYRYDEALALFKDVQDKQREIYGKTSPVVLSTKSFILTALFFKDQHYDNIKDLQEVVKMQKAWLPEVHPDVLSTQNSLAQAYFLKKHYLNAYSLSKLTYDRGKIIFGNSHPQILKAQALLTVLNSDIKIIYRNLQPELKLAILNGDVITVKRL